MTNEETEQQSGGYLVGVHGGRTKLESRFKMVSTETQIAQQRA